jgi:hypothetical protein
MNCTKATRGMESITLAVVLIRAYTLRLYLLFVLVSVLGVEQRSSLYH